MTRGADKRAALLKERRAQQALQPQEPVPSAEAAARAHFVGSSVMETLTQGRTVQALPVDQIAPDLRPDRRQPRLLPLPDELVHDGGWNEAERTLIDELLTLGESLRERQIQPIVVCAGTSERYPTAQYLIVVGHRRWTAASLVGLPTIEAVIIEPPDAADLAAIQFSENEERAEFCDMERAWALERMRQLLPDASWEAIETRMRMSESRRKQLMRLTTFSGDQQRTIARLRASEFQLRPLHTALREGELGADQANQVLLQLATRTNKKSAAPPADPEAQPAPPVVFDQAEVARLVARTQRRAEPASPTRPRWFAPLQQTVRQSRVALERAAPRVRDLDAALIDELQEDVNTLLHALEATVAALAAYERERADEG